MDKYDEMLSELENQQKEIKEAIEKIKRVKSISQCIAPKWKLQTFLSALHNQQCKK